MKRIFRRGGNALAKTKAAADELLSVACSQYCKSLEKYCRVRLGEASGWVDDCVQETYYVYYKKLLAGETIEKPKAFLYRTADNMIKRLKAEHYKNAARITPLEEAQDVAFEMVDEVITSLDYDELKEILLLKLSEQEQHLYKMKYVEKRSLKEIGKKLDIPPATVANRTSRLRSKIRSLLSQVIEDSLKGGG